MANTIFIDVTELIKAAQKLKGMEKELAESVDQVLNANAVEIATKAKKLAPVDMGGLRGSINPDVSKPLSKSVSVNVFYAPFIEFGTGKYAAAYVGSLPPDWAAMALKFKGKKGGGDYFDFLNNILDWVKRTGLSTVVNSYTGKKVGGKAAKENLVVLAEAIAWSILRKGVKPHPFLFPAYEQQRPQIAKDIAAVVNALIAVKWKM